MLNFGNKEFRNLEEQVGKNQEDILEIKQSLGEALPEPIPGPQGPAGPQGATGATGARGLGIIGAGTTLPSTANEGDMFIHKVQVGTGYDCLLKRYENSTWNTKMNIRGTQGLKGDDGDVNVVANPVGTATTQLTKIDIDGTIYWIPTSSNYVTLNTTQTIDGSKRFEIENTQTFAGETIFLQGDEGQRLVVENGQGSQLELYVDEDLEEDIQVELPTASGKIALTSDLPSLSNYVTLNTNQTISGGKTFTGGIVMQSVDIDMYNENEARTSIIANENTSENIGVILPSTDGTLATEEYVDESVTGLVTQSEVDDSIAEHNTATDAHSTLLATKQDKLSASQQAACNSGITALKVAAYDTYQSSKQDKLSALNKLSANYISGLATVAYTADYGDLSNTPVNISSFTNDSGYITSSALSSYATQTDLQQGLATKETVGVCYTRTEADALINAKSVVSGTNDGTNWTNITINGTTKAIPAGGGGTPTNMVTTNTTQSITGNKTMKDSTLYFADSIGNPYGYICYSGGEFVIHDTQSGINIVSSNGIKLNGNWGSSGQVLTSDGSYESAYWSTPGGGGTKLYSHSITLAGKSFKVISTYNYYYDESSPSQLKNDLNSGKVMKVLYTDLGDDTTYQGNLQYDDDSYCHFFAFKNAGDNETNTSIKTLWLGYNPTVTSDSLTEL